MLPLLKLSSDGEIHEINNTTEELAKYFKLTDGEKKELLPSGKQATFTNRVGWARTYLKKSELIEYPRRGHFRITERGKLSLNENLQKIDNAYLSHFPEFIEFRKRSKRRIVSSNTESEQEEFTPEELPENSYQKIRNDLADNLLEQILKSSSFFFEKLVVELLVAMGYGETQSDAARAVGKVGDEGIDGIIDEDRLGLDSIYIQAKKWQKDKSVGRPEVQAFVGALEGKRANKGIFITTANFTDRAHEYVDGLNKKVVLIDGDRLADLMIDFGIGVTTRNKYEIKELDSDYFDEITLDLLKS
jgi:restriction system protein